MALIQKFDSSDLYDIAVQWGRGQAFGYKGWNAIGDYLEQLSEDIGEDVEIDIVGICCEYYSADDAEDFWYQFGQEIGYPTREEWDCLGTGEKLEAIEEYLRENTFVVICEEDCIIWQAF